MHHPELAALLTKRLEVIADHTFRDRDPEAHLASLGKVSEDITRWHQQHAGTLDPRLDHFLGSCSFDKALRYLESDSTWKGH